ncbi:tetratricopeptide repeat protein [Streptomyces sp. LZ34]
MADDTASGLLASASRSLGECEYLLRHGENATLGLLANAHRYCDQAEQKMSSGDTETAATIAILRSTVAAFTLRHCALFQVRCDFDDNDGTLLNGMGKYDEEGLSRPLTEQAVRVARTALHEDPEDALVPLQLGHALTWSGDRDGAVAAYEEALRRDPGDRCARSCLRYLKAAPGRRPSPNRMSHGRHGFALLRFFFWINNNDWDHGFLLFGSVPDARAYTDRWLDGDARKMAESDPEDDEDDGIVLHIHRPGRRVAEYDLKGRVRTDSGGRSSRVDWSDIPVCEPLESPLPPGRPLRINSRTCFYGGSG